MNIQDIADFIDLVKNPTRYEQVLRNIKEEQERLNAVIATVGKASELDKLRKEVEKERETLQLEFDKATKERDTYVEREVEVLTKKKIEYTDAISKATELAAKADLKFQEASALIKSYEGREKEIKRGEEGLVVRQRQLDTLVAEYNEKVTKLRSVMV